MYSISINKIPVTEFMTVKISQNLNSFQKMSTQWNQECKKDTQMNAKHSKINWLKKVIEFKTNE